MKRGIYIASKVKHAQKWRHLRATGAPIISSWIDEAGEGQTTSYDELAERCLREVMDSKAVILYCEPGDVLKGVLIEVGAALAANTQVYCVGTCESISRIFARHPLWIFAKSVENAIADASGYVGEGK